jgi:hypothetical protein
MMNVPEDSYLAQFITQHNPLWASELDQWQIKRVTYLLAKLVLLPSIITCGGARAVACCD